MNIKLSNQENQMKKYVLAVDAINKINKEHENMRLVIKDQIYAVSRCEKLLEKIYMKVFPEGE